MNSIPIPIHSFVDLITNSSSETFVCADKKTVQAVKELVNTFLRMGGLTQKADDLFTFELVLAAGQMEYVGGDYDKELSIDAEIPITSKEAKAFIAAREDNGDCPTYHTKMRVTAKPGMGDLPNQAAKILSKLNDLFQAEEYSSG